MVYGEYRALARINAEKSPVYNTVLFPKLWQIFEEKDLTRILDLYSVQPGTLAFLSEKNCFLTVCDSVSDIIFFQHSIHNDEYDVKVHGLKLSQLEKPGEKSFDKYDIVLLWDILNYLDNHTLTDLQNYLLKYTRSSSRIYALLYTSEKKPVSPLKYVIESNNIIRQYEDVKEYVKNQVLTPTKLKRVFNNYEVEKAALMRNGIQEILLKPKA